MIFMLFLFPLNTQAGCTRGDCINGYGTMAFSDGREYVGEFKNGKMSGHGTMVFLGMKCIGEFKDGIPHGRVTFTYSDGKVYVGEYRDGKRNIVYPVAVLRLVAQGWHILRQYRSQN